MAYPLHDPTGAGVPASPDLPAVERAAAEQLVDAAHQVCPYSNATRGNVEVTRTVREAR